MPLLKQLSQLTAQGVAGLLNRRLPDPWPGSELAEDTGDRSAWDEMIIGGFIVPGIVEVHVPHLGRQVLKRRSPSHDSETVTLSSYLPAEIVVSVRMWTSDQFDDWLAFCDTLQPKPGGKKEVWGIYHPALNAQGITKAIIESMTVPTRGVGREVDIWKAELKLHEWNKLLAGSPKTPTAAKPVATAKEVSTLTDKDAPSKTATKP